MISQPARLSIGSRSLVVQQEQVAKIPLEDIAIVVLAHKQIQLTHPVLSAFADYGIALYSMGNNHHPNGVFLPFQQHTRSTRMIRLQLGMNRPLRKRLWSLIIFGKLQNQAKCLALLGNDQDSQVILTLSRRVRSGDKDNIEAKASRKYFISLFGSRFVRSRECLTNSALNYGYAVLRGAIARVIVGHGLLPTLGIFHDNEQNAFNLADDLMEPFRPVVDLLVAKEFGDRESGDLTTQDKAGLIGCLHLDMQNAQGKLSVNSAIKHLVESLIRAYESGECDELALPMLVELKQHSRDK